MTNIKTIADFKRAMIPGTFWEATHQYIGEHPSEPKSLGVRECALNNSVDFGFKTDNGISYSPWPKKGEFITEENGTVVVITKPGFCQLRYIQRG
jgi:hypothetical protein